MEVKAREIEIDKASMVLKLLGDKTRLSMVKLLEKNDCCVCEFVEIFNVSQSAISQHLRKLRDLGLVKEKRKGQWIFYSLNQDSELYDMLMQVLAFIPSQDERIEKLVEQGLRIRCE
ncbi:MULTISPECIES: helix-turn-helix transcriptional regulator [unclassified Planococcus (in: firmicutes)]|uniref:ArsR/SmtB family transcription factor n=1 Tax=unclassified Planococcus (in: firmicutes) TaxID=2662419 RepID=UPI000C329FC7|nr:MULTISPECIES: metalloregulator ArsR/SmtB family transcription factor [unclassified Planococcus (in: firmicutes)]MDN5709857.1 metalloregulator ArsR/SmtB family transcription factor [Planococcus sp. (in: firmicutes)]AUD14355.1 ArsR family transcriptional regulator [Planococcus sp. MB-3u-03]PKG46653.1 ArsR family transcriptional regulator [Planococcus sp. Urea-trap-24]PKG89494.1 ArsR family transcriptional regulator [Planococcus sp. Urea-3u-39]PKH42072.1 ArsR family transcriptional regulator [